MPIYLLIQPCHNMQNVSLATPPWTAAVDLGHLACTGRASKLYAIHHAAGQAELIELEAQSATVPVPLLYRLHCEGEGWRG